jgi:predicted oxidoreductase
MVKTFQLPGTDMVVPAVVLGLMRIQDKSDDEVRTLVAAAMDAGITCLDHADVYGSELHGCERRFAEAMRLTSSQRDKLIIQSKAGIVREGPYFDFSYEHLVSSVDGSLKALDTDHLDILLLHRPDALVEPEEVARAFDDLAAAGKVRAFGISNHTPRQIELLRRHVRQPLVVNQLQLSVTHAPLVAQGTAANMQGLDQSISRDDGLLDYCRLNDITVQAWSPFQAGFFDGPFLGSPSHRELNTVIDRLADKYDVPALAIATAWITRHPARMQVVIGTTTPQRVTDAARGSEVPLTRAEWYEMFRAAGYTVP